MSESTIKNIVQKYGNSREYLLEILNEVVEEKHFLSEKSISEVAEQLDMPASTVFGMASFYSFLNIEPCGKYVIRICKTITCDMKGKNQIIKTIEDLLKVKLGDTTSDKKFTLLTTNCLGWCHKGPAMLVNNEVYTDLTVEKVEKIISDYINK